MKSVAFLAIIIILLLIVFAMKYILNWIGDTTLQIILLVMLFLVIIIKEKLNINFF